MEAIRVKDKEWQLAGNEVTISMANVVNPTHVKSGHVYPSSGN